MLVAIAHLLEVRQSVAVQFALPDISIDHSQFIFVTRASLVYPTANLGLSTKCGGFISPS